MRVSNPGPLLLEFDALPTELPDAPKVCFDTLKMASSLINLVNVSLFIDQHEDSWDVY